MNYHVLLFEDALDIFKRGLKRLMYLVFNAFYNIYISWCSERTKVSLFSSGTPTTVYLKA